ncbi:hypothetical protein HanPI659440_Chr14g0525571 [Helianthus annuus]|nr:hypothetical protein HanPI659440_Chr14g0525571 [Helianthus annuus]
MNTLPGLRRGVMPGPDSVGIFTISQSCSEVAARVYGLVSLEPTKILKCEYLLRSEIISLAQVMNCCC